MLSTKFKPGDKVYWVPDPNDNAKDCGIVCNEDESIGFLKNHKLLGRQCLVVVRWESDGELGFMGEESLFLADPQEKPISEEITQKLFPELPTADPTDPCNYFGESMTCQCKNNEDKYDQLMDSLDLKKEINNFLFYLVSEKTTVKQVNTMTDTVCKLIEETYNE